MSVEVNTELSMNKLNKRGAAMEPWGTPACTFFAEIQLLFICTDCFRFLSNYTSNRMCFLKTQIGF